MLLAENKS